MPAPSTTLLIEGSFSELAEEFAAYLDALTKPDDTTIQTELAPLLQPLREQEQNDTQIDQSKRDEVLKKLVSAATVLNTAPEKEITPAYNLLIHLVQQASDPDMFLSRICSYLAKPISSSPQFGASLSIAILSTIFNTLAPSDSSRFHVLLAVIAVIRQSGSSAAFDALKPQLTAQLPNWRSAWELDDEEARRLHLAIADAAQAAGDLDWAQTHVVEALQTIPPAEASSPAARDLAVRALTSALTHPAVFDFTPLTAADAVQALRSSDAPLFELLEIFTADTLDAYEDFISTTPVANILPDNALTPHAEALQTKIRLLTLASLAAAATTTTGPSARSLSYETIASSLRVPQEEVEKWVIDTIRAGLVEGKLSQLRSEFLVHRATYRVFGEKQWAEVQGRLMVWRRSLENVLGVVRSERERFVREAAAQAAAAAEAEKGEKSNKGQSERRRAPQEVAAAE
ncbi:PCI domain protein [Aspergillus mulundensis]|uniref:Eukaryotic translation initiation factor 3 subunit M n=1 Tax=Aspergillus mulundensis TaxID=1810919 RepID=A0A3D8T3Y0_9EURO|nr:Eukaryotic translation initiation factor 3 subunit M [Aspergillus mulundensis]RDW93254.1 Eukaryotic translation initiation factor 3 subunit M [Aspergillus mulundensis]